MYDQLKTLGEQLLRRAPNCKNEEATKQALILPFIQALGYDIYDPTEVLPEYRADFAKKPSEKVDYAIMSGKAPGIFVEAKIQGAPLEDHDGQLGRYFNSTISAKLGVITDGVNYRFFTDLRNTNVMDPEPFFVFSFEALTERDAEILRNFTKGVFDPAKTTLVAEDVAYTEKAQQKVTDLLRRPSEEFIRFILEDIFPGRLTGKTVERFTPIIQKALQNAIVATVSKAVTVPAYDDVEVELVPEEAQTKRGIETTQEELDFFGAVSAVIGQPLEYKDTLNYFAIQGKEGKTFLRATFNSKTKALWTNLPVEEVQKMLPNYPVTASTSPTGKTRVMLATTTNLSPELIGFIREAYTRGG